MTENNTNNNKTFFLLLTFFIPFIMIEAPKKVNNNGVEQHAPDDTEEIEPNDNRKFHQQSVMSVTSSSIPKQKILPLLHKNREQYFSSSTKWIVFGIVLVSQIL